MENPAAATAAIRHVVDNVERVIAGKRATIQASVVCLFAEGNLLLEGVPGVGKTMLARALARSIGGTFRRIQATPDLLPSDITGVSIFDQERREFRFVPGPIFANVVLVDEINRTTPRTQSALLEPMEERQVTVEGATYRLPSPFFLVATQNPVEHHGTYPLPEGQVDRFAMTVSLGYPDAAAAREMVDRQMLEHPIIDLQPVLRPDDVLLVQRTVRAVHVAPATVEYAVALVEATREHPDVALGGSPRAVLALTRSAQAHALASGRDYTLPDDLKAVAHSVLAHRLMLERRVGPGSAAARSVVDSVLDGVPIPLGVSEPV